MPLSRITSPFQSATANVYSPSANTIAFRTSSTDRLRINSDGNTVTNRNINITSDNNEFAANTNGIQIQPQGRIFIDSSADWLMELSGNTTSRVRIYSSTGGQSTTVGSITASATSALFNAGSVQLNANGITFPASQNASSDQNTLDDYEEGSWTPTISGSSSGTVTTGARYGTYTKIGNLVVAQFAIINPGPGTTAISGSWRLSGLPFAQSASFRGYGKVSWKRYIPVNTNGTEMTLFGELSSTFMNIGWHTNNTNESDYIFDGSVAQDTLFEGYMTYYV